MMPEMKSCIVIGRLPPCRRGAPDTLLAGQHDEHEHEADHQFPIAEHFAQYVLHAGVDDRADQRPVQRADAAENGHHDGLGGARRAGDFRADEAEIDGIHRAGERGGRVGDDEGDEPDLEVAVAEEVHLVLVGLHRKAAGAEDRIVEIFEEGPQREGDQESENEELFGPRQIEDGGRIQIGEEPQPVVAVGDAGQHLLHHVKDDHRQRQIDQREVVAAQPDEQRADGERHRNARDNAD
jgi:hypothetical protein